MNNKNITNLNEHYEQFGEIKTANHKNIGFTAKKIGQVIDILTNSKFLYTRQRNYRIAVMHRDATSPTGVINVGSVPNELEFLISKFQKYGSPLSPTEDLRSGIQ